MKTSMLPMILLHMLAYAVCSSAAPPRPCSSSSPYHEPDHHHGPPPAYSPTPSHKPTSSSSSSSSSTPTPTPTPTPQPTFKLRVWNKVNGPGVVGYDGYVEEDSSGHVFYNITKNYPGDDVHFDSGNIGMIHKSDGSYGALIPTTTPGLYDLYFKPSSETPGSGTLTQAFSTKQLQCGNCNGRYLQYDTTINAGNTLTDTTNSGFLIVPNPQIPGSWKLQWNQWAINPTSPTGSVALYLLR